MHSLKVRVKTITLVSRTKWKKKVKAFLIDEQMLKNVWQKYIPQILVFLGHETNLHRLMRKIAAASKPLTKQPYTKTCITETLQVNYYKISLCYFEVISRVIEPQSTHKIPVFCSCNLCIRTSCSVDWQWQ